MIDYKRILISMGYRLLYKNVWSKPIGFHTFVFNLLQLEWINYFVSINDTSDLCIYESKIFDPEERDNFLTWLKSMESYTKIQCGWSDAKFEFLTPEQFYELS